MGDFAIRVEDLSKKYHIGAKQQYRGSFRETIVDTVNAPFRRAGKLLRGHATGAAGLDEVIWALKDVSFDVKHGEVVGIIGRNGAGKSTLLKILSRITKPTEGRARLYGRVGSLLEVGTGFHPELTGRENIYLNGAILGMSRDEIDRKFDEIVDFSGVEKFIDTPVKHYSSGMTVRLAFAVAAHLEPEILIVDEVLAVGDAEFQKKCLDKMNDVAGEGRTILFVSHNMAAIHSLCSRAILLQTGESVFDGQVDDTINRYISSVQSMVSEQSLSLRTDRTGGERFRFDAVEFLDAETMAPTSTLLSGQSILIRLNFTCTEEAGLQAVSISIGFYGLTSGFLFACRSDAVGKSYDIDAGKGEFVCRIPRWPLNHGRFRYNLIARSRGEIVDWVREAGFIDSELGDFFGTGRLPASTHQGVFVEYDYAQQMSFIAEEQT